MTSKFATYSKIGRSKKLPKLTRKDLGDLVPKRNGSIVPPISSWLMKVAGWRTVGEIPNISQAVVLALPHTSNIDGVYALPCLFALDVKISIMGKHTLFKVPVLKHLLQWMGIIPINRSAKGSVLQTSIDKFKNGEPLFLGLSPEGTRDYTESWKTGFYYLALGANVPILPVALDYNTKEVRFLSPVYPTGDIEADLPKIYQQYRGVLPRHPERLSQPLQDINNTIE
ncbi:lysophospholipid acyltransferase family protein [Psychrobacter sp. TAE2020]|uniref:lysophospholipid acyltransferase family protein n=1 Tax=Psychrobacter sp. TAE2020 TaxID=2846762 RepID=UPI001C1247B6|nr:lysophospholipid acyltransferase family protein [Psychrobacter sp. TAE2020]MBU5617200.1 lysophospholipid acyltransferase family protein [Psychrobacter sp. TAE2020]